MQRIVDQLTSALETVRWQQQVNSETTRDKRQGFFASLFSGESDAGRSPFSSPEYKRLPAHLEQAIRNFCNIFDVSDVPLWFSVLLRERSECLIYGSSNFLDTRLVKDSSL